MDIRYNEPSGTTDFCAPTYLQLTYFPYEKIDIMHFRYNGFFRRVPKSVISTADYIPILSSGKKLPAVMKTFRFSVTIICGLNSDLRRCLGHVCIYLGYCTDSELFEFSNKQSAFSHSMPYLPTQVSPRPHSQPLTRHTASG